ncbi:MAG: transketolase family protein [Spirochaetaceae bacterium]|jgi:transketolase|nr:transketolase family protein [Spirochaetaceae bacterium]
MIVYNGSMDKEPHKNVLGRVIEDLCAQDRDVIYLDADLMNSSGTYKLWKKNPSQVINCGIAEADMAGIAAGLSSAGKKPYMHTFGPFASRRCFDQVFISAAYGGNPVRILGSDPGVTAAFNGGTHMPFEDMALMRAIPESTVIDVADAAQFEAVLRLIKDRRGVTYVRFSRKNYPAVYSPDHRFEVGKGQVVREGRDATIIACGLMTTEALKAAGILKDRGIDVRVVDMFTVKPLDGELVKTCAKETGVIVTSENHNVIGGLGDAVAACVLESGIPVKFKKHGVCDTFGSVGPQDYLQEFYGLTGQKLAETLLSLLG